MKLNTLIACGLIATAEAVRTATAHQQTLNMQAEGQVNAHANEAATEAARARSDGSSQNFLRRLGSHQSTAGWVVCFCSFIGLVYSFAVYKLHLSKIQLIAKKTVDEEGDPEELENKGSSPEEIVQNMENISAAIAEGAESFMYQEFKVLIPFLFMGGFLIGTCVGWHSALAFMIGSFTSGLCGWLGMRIAVYCNVLTCHQCWFSLHKGFRTALLGGSMMGFTLVSIGVLSFLACILLLNNIIPADKELHPSRLVEAMCGFGLGASTVALFARVGGGIYTKAADVGADLSGKNEYGMDEDDPRNPACIADNVGDNVGDIAGMGADLFGSFAESTCAACFIWVMHSVVDPSTGITATSHMSPLLYPLVISASGIITGVLTILFALQMETILEEREVEQRLKVLLMLSTGLQTVMAFVVGHTFLPHHVRISDYREGPITDIEVTVCVLMGLWSGMLIGLTTEYYTSHSYSPVREVSEAYHQSASTGLILGYSLGFKSVFWPLCLIAVMVSICLLLCGPFGIAMAGIGMLSTLTIALTIDAYGPIADNAGGIAEMAGLGKTVRRRTDCLDAAGNTTAAIGKGFAIGSAALVGLALFQA